MTLKILRQFHMEYSKNEMNNSLDHIFQNILITDNVNWFVCVTIRLSISRCSAKFDQERLFIPLTIIII